MDSRVQIINSCIECQSHLISFDPQTSTAYHLCKKESKIITSSFLKDINSIPDAVHIKIPDWCMLPSEIQFASQFDRDVKEGLK